MHIGRQITRGLKVSFLSLGLLFCISIVAGAAELVGGIEPKMQGEQLIRALKKGGYVIFFRHGATTTVGEKSVEKKDLDNCSVQRNLSPEGKAQVQAMGKAIKRHKIPIGDVYTSPYCRCVDTAMNLFGKGEKSDALHFGIHTSKTEREENTQRLLEKLATPPRARMNTALVSHTSNLNSAVQIFPRPEGVAHVFKPEGRGTFSYVGMVLPETWINSKPLPSADQAGENKEGWLSSIKQWFSF